MKSHKPMMYTAQFNLPVTNYDALPDDGAEYEVFVEGTVRCLPAEYEQGYLFWPAYNEVWDTFKVIEVTRDGIPLQEFDQAFWDSLIDEKELDSRVSEFEPN